MEAESGTPLPALCPGFNRPRPREFKVLKFIGTVVLALLTGMFVAITSVLIASSIVVGLGRPDHATGDMRYPSPGTALGILLATTVCEVVGVALIIKAFRRRGDRERDSAAPAPAPARASASAPAMAAVFATAGTDVGGGRGGGKVDTVTFVSEAGTINTDAGQTQSQQSVSAALESVRRGINGIARSLPLPGSSTTAAAEGGYSVLPADDIAHMAIVTGVPVTAQQQRGAGNHYI